MSTHGGIGSTPTEGVQASDNLNPIIFQYILIPNEHKSLHLISHYRMEHASLKFYRISNAMSLAMQGQVAVLLLDLYHYIMDLNCFWRKVMSFRFPSHGQLRGVEEDEEKEEEDTATATAEVELVVRMVVV
jgi:hypothetical protein